MDLGIARDVAPRPGDAGWYSEPTKPCGARRHACVIALLAALSILFTWPAFEHPTREIPGRPGDNLLFLWDIWRTQRALELGANPLFTQLVLYPHRHSVVFHTHAILHAALLYPFRAYLGLAGTYNTWAFGSLVVGGWGAFLLARRVLGDDRAALFAACVFTLSPFRLAHLDGHMMMVSAHWIPFYVLLLLRLREGAPLHALGAGIVLGLTLWTDLHYALHLVIFTGATLVWWLWRNGLPAARRTLAQLGLAGAVVGVFAIPLAAATQQDSESPLRVADGGSIPQRKDTWIRSAQVASFLLPPMHHPILGRWGKNNTERQLYLGVGIIALVALAWRRRPAAWSDIHYWAAMSAVVVVFALGPVLMIRSKNTLCIHGREFDLPMPYAALQWVPGIRMCRAPARFMGIGTLAIGILAGFGLRTLLRARRSKWAIGLATCTAFEFVAAPFPTTRIQPPSELRELTRRGGSVIDLPFGAGSAVRSSGVLDYACALYQTVHELPRVGGMLSRCRDEDRRELLRQPVLGSLLRLSQGETIDDAARRRDADGAASVLRSYNIRHILVQRREVGKSAHRYIMELFPLAAAHRLSDGTIWISLTGEDPQEYGAPG
jgi:hypothetical protein